MRGDDVASIRAVPFLRIQRPERIFPVTERSRARTRIELTGWVFVTPEGRFRLTAMSILGFFIANASGFAQTTQVTGRVLDQCGRTLPGTAITLVHEAGTVARTLVDGEGRYSFSALAPGRWTITFALLGFQTHEQGIPLFENTEAVELSIRLLRDPLLKEELYVTHGDPNVHYRRYSVHGFVTGETGGPVAGATIRLQHIGAGNSPLTEVCTTDDGGRYSVSGWASRPSRWRLAVVAGGYRPYTHPAFELASEESRTINIRLRAR
jgi:protocatechuate 3,4-dioxygenase beta subunit